MTLKQSQSHQSYNEYVDPKEGYAHAKFERSHFNSVWEKGNVIIFFQPKKYVNCLPWPCAKTQNSDIVIIYLT